MAKPRVPTLKPRIQQARTDRVQLLNPDAWRVGKTTAERGYGGKWQRYRIRFLEKNPLCHYCTLEGRVTAATVVDHSQPHRGDMTLFWRTELHVACCGPCHSAKTAREEGGIGWQRRG